jgi:hypothetical protein
MAKYVVLKLAGEPGYWLVDFDQKTVTPMDDIAADAFGYSADASDSGASLISGVDVVVATESRDDAFAGKFDT